ncbi:MAG: anion permease [Ignisphaera sp.]|nr:anion permease [Ignisphaera sp.]
MNTFKKAVIIFVLILAASITAMHFLYIGKDSTGLLIARQWCEEIGLNASNSMCLEIINSGKMSLVQGVSLALFLFAIALTVIRMEWRTAAAMLALAILIVVGIAAPQDILNAVSWNLILFLVGSMTLAGIFRELGIFRYLALRILELARNNVIILIILLSLLSYALSAALGEVTSIVYVTMLALEIASIMHVDVASLIILSVLATNTGSSAMPIGNPIGVYLLFKTGMSVSTFIRTAFPLSILNLVVLLATFITLEKGFISMLDKAFKKFAHRIEAYVARHRIDLRAGNREALRILIGLGVLLAFILTVAFNDFIVQMLSKFYRTPIDPHAFLTFVPYIFIIIMFAVIPMEEISKFVEKSVEWSSILFFVFLFMLSHVLTYTGVMAKLAYVFSHAATSQLTLLLVMLFASAVLSSVLDNLSVIVTFTPIAMLFNQIGLTGSLAYFALLFGGVFGGNYTPVGSTANIVAVGLAEKRKIKITWGNWLRLALASTTLQLVVSLLYLYLF